VSYAFRVYSYVEFVDLHEKESLASNFKHKSVPVTDCLLVASSTDSLINNVWSSSVPYSCCVCLSVWFLVSVCFTLCTADGNKLSEYLFAY